MSGLGVAQLLAILPAEAQGYGAMGAVSPGTMGEGPINTCFWGRPSSNVGPINELNYPVVGTNAEAPETNAVYYQTNFQLPAGATVTLHGEYPHSRFFSLTTYVIKAGVPGYPEASIYDEDITPEPGSINPYRAGALRDSSKRSYSLTISGRVAPAAPAQNTLYIGQRGKTGEAQRVQLVMRIYRPDRNLEANAGVPLPSPTLTEDDGSSLSEEEAVCRALQDRSGVYAVKPPEARQVEGYLSLRELAPLPHPADDPIEWERFFNPLRALEPFYRGAGEPYEGLIGTLPSTLSSPPYATPSNAYLLGYADRSIGPNAEGHNILVLQAEMPTHPTTYDGNPINNSGGTQVRYWSLCAYGAVSFPADSACLFDQEVPTNAAGEYTIVISLPEDRPKNATPGCGVAWLNWGTAGDALGGAFESDRRSTLDLLVIRNQLSSASFSHSVADVIVPGTEEEVMGAYYPSGIYMTKHEFEARSCV